MQQKVFDWKEGGGSLEVMYEGFESGSINMSSTVNEGLDREMELLVGVTQGRYTVEKKIKILQEGKREEYVDINGQKYITADGQEYLILKQKYAE